MALLAHWRMYLAAALLAGSFLAGWKTASWRADSIELGAVEQQREMYVLRARMSSALGAKLEAKREQTRTVFRTVYKDREVYISRPVYASDCVDDDGLRNLNRAIGGEAPGAAQRDDGMPSNRQIGGEDRQAPARQADRAGAGVPRVPG